MKRTTIAGWLLALVSFVCFGQAWACGNYPPGGSIPWSEPPKPQPPVWNIDGLWWGSPAGSQSGWGLSIERQGETVFATWFTYDLDGSGMWIIMPDVRWDGHNYYFPGYYAGTLYRTTGPGFNAIPWDSSKTQQNRVGSAKLWFDDANRARFDVRITVDGVTLQKVIPITRFVFAPQVSSEIHQDESGPYVNYSGLWWTASESGWGVNLTQQGEVLMAAWFTYRPDGEGEWLVMPNSVRSGDTAYTGTLYRTHGPAFNQIPWDPSKVTQTAVGTATFSFGDGNNGVFAYTLDGVSQAKPITRYYVSPPAPPNETVGGDGAKSHATKGCSR